MRLGLTALAYDECCLWRKRMISDVLADACHQIREYLEDPVYYDMYSGKLRDEIERVVGEMDRLRAKLDLPPTHAEQPQ